MKTAGRKIVNDLDIDAYFSRLAKLMKTNSPTAQDAPTVAEMAKIGLIPGQDYDPGKLGFLSRLAIKVAPKLAELQMGLLLKSQKTTNGWLYFTRVLATLAQTINSAAWPTFLDQAGTVRKTPCIRFRKKMRMVTHTTAPITNTWCGSRRANYRRQKPSGR